MYRKLIDYLHNSPSQRMAHLTRSERWMTIALTAFETFSRLIEDGRPLNMDKHGQLLLDLQQELGSEPITLIDPLTREAFEFDSGLLVRREGEVLANVEYLNQPGVLNRLVLALKAMIEVTGYDDHIHFIDFKRSEGACVRFAVNNAQIYEVIKDGLTSTTLQQLFDLAKANGVFDLEFDNGVSRVSGSAPATTQMKRIWFRDHAGTKAAIEAFYPDQVLPGILLMAKTYTSPTEQQAFDRVIRNPELFTQDLGVAHVFYYGTYYKSQLAEVLLSLETLQPFMDEGMKRFQELFLSLKSTYMTFRPEIDPARIRQVLGPDFDHPELVQSMIDALDYQNKLSQIFITLEPNLLNYKEMMSESTIRQVFPDPVDAALVEKLIEGLRDKEGKLVRDDDWINAVRVESSTEGFDMFLEKIQQSIVERNRQRYEASTALFDGFAGQIHSQALYRQDCDIPDDLITATVNFAHYLKALGPNTPTSGAWEELQMKGGTNWDSASGVLAFQQLRRLVELLWNGEHDELKTRFLSAEAALLARNDKATADSLFSQDYRLVEAYVTEGMMTIRQHYLDFFRGVTDRNDASAVFITASDLTLSDDKTYDVIRHLDILDKFIKLEKEYGAMRYNEFQIELTDKEGHVVYVYSPDSYQNLDYYLSIDPQTGGLHLKKAIINETFFEGKDVSDPVVFMLRARGVTEATSAQWALPMSYAAIGYARQVAKLLDLYQEQGFNTIQQGLFKKAYLGMVEQLMRTYGNISGTKADGSYFIDAGGKPIKPWCSTEAMMAVHTLTPLRDDAAYRDKQIGWLPGANQNLAWDIGKKLEATQWSLEVMKRVEALGLTALLENP